MGKVEEKKILGDIMRIIFLDLYENCKLTDPRSNDQLQARKTKKITPKVYDN